MKIGGPNSAVSSSSPLHPFTFPPFSLPSLSPSSLPFPLEVGPLKCSWGVWGSAASSPSGV